MVIARALAIIVEDDAVGLAKKRDPSILRNVDAAPASFHTPRRIRPRQNHCLLNMTSAAHRIRS